MSKKALAVKPTTAAQQAAKTLAKLPEALQKMKDRVEQKLVAGDHSIILNRHDIGVMLKQVHDDEAKYGSAAIEKLATVLHRSASELYSFKQIAEVYSRDELEKLVERRSTSGAKLSYSHVRALSSVSGEKERRSLETQFFKTVMTVDEMIAKIKGIEGERSNNRKSLATGTNPTGGLVRLSRMSEVFLREREIFTRALSGLEAMEEEKYNDKLLQQLQDAESNQRNLESFAAESRRRLDVLVDKTTKLVATRDSAKRPSRAEKESKGTRAAPAPAPAAEDDADVDPAPAPRRTSTAKAAATKAAPAKAAPAKANRRKGHVPITAE